jgi:uncharacterized protein YjiS (DUF1127 family)
MATGLTNVVMNAVTAPTVLIGQIARNYREWRDYRDTSDQLARLSPRQLYDLGLDGGVDDVAHMLAVRRNR